MGKRNIKLELSYDGTDFSGWQSQAEGRTVQGVIAEALSKIHGCPVAVSGAGRTDAGVHASGQVANFHTEKISIRDAQFRNALNFYLPPDVRILKSSSVDEIFHARFSARGRIYRYFMYFGETALPYYERYAVRFRKRPDIGILNRCASLLVGDHDFTTFAGAQDSSLSKRRIVESCCFYVQGDFLVFKIGADSFLYKMVRSLVGTLMECARDEKDVDRFRDILDAKDRTCAGTTAPAHGLFLDRVIYDEQDIC